MDEFNQGFGQSTDKAHALRMRMKGAFPTGLNSKPVTAPVDLTWAQSEAPVDLTWAQSGVGPTSLNSPPPSPTGLNSNPVNAPVDLSWAQDGVGRAPIEFVQPPLPFPIGGPAPPPEVNIPGQSGNNVGNVPQAPQVVPTSAAFGGGLACFVYTVESISDVFGTPALPPNRNPTCAALVFYTEGTGLEDGFRGEASYEMLDFLHDTAPGESDFDSLMQLANNGSLLMGECNAEPVLQRTLQGLPEGQTYEDVEFDTSESGESGGDDSDSGGSMMTGLVVAAALAAYYLMEKG